MDLSRLRSLFRRLRRRAARPSVLGLAWYREEQWPLLLQVSEDTADLEKTFSQWERHAQHHYDEYVRQARPVQKVVVDVVDMTKWCSELGRKVNSEGRALYVAYRLEQQKMDQMGPTITK